MGPLLTDLYQLTMAQGYWKNGMADREAVFDLHFRSCPFGGGYAVAAGLAPVMDWLQGFRFLPDDIGFLAGLTGNDGKPLFERGFLDHLAGMRLAVDVDAVPEGTVVFANEPLVRVRGPIIQGQLLETALLCMVNFDTLIATKAARIVQAAGGAPVLEFGLRRAQGPGGGMAAARAAHIGGCAATSNVLAGRVHGIPVKGTHAHSWVMSFDDEPAAFAAYTDAMPNNCVFLVDTYDTLDGVRHAIDAGRALRERGHAMIGIRLDSGDLAWLSREARRMLDEAGFPDAAIVASNDLDERTIGSIRAQGGQIAVWGVGTKLITAHDQPALGGVYKLSAIRAADGVWLPKVKLSEQAIKTSIPGIRNTRRFVRDGLAVADAIWDESAPPDGPWEMVDPADPTRRMAVGGPDMVGTDLLVPVHRAGGQVLARPTLAASRARTMEQLRLFHDGVRRLDNPHRHPVGIEAGLHDRRTALILAARAGRRPA